jgi:hypothetical protein
VHRSFKRSAVATFVGAATAGTLLLAAAPAFGTSTLPSADPCGTTWTGVPGITSFTAEITSNPCGIPVRAYVDCGGNLGNNARVYGPFVRGTGSSKAECGRMIPLTTRYGVTV